MCQRYYACPNSRENTERGWGYFYVGWMLSWTVTPQSILRERLQSPSHFSGNFLHGPVNYFTIARSRMTAVLNCKFLAERIKTLEARISVLEGQLEMARHPENHTLESAGILHEIYQGMRNLNME
ncbi:hypothetical protein Tco_0504840 [Tanacetum coccineum]